VTARITDSRPALSYDTDVLVVGGGAAGVAAAVTAARAGAKVLLLEKYGFCGGAAVAGLSGTICGLYASTEDSARPPEQIVFGFAEQFLALMRQKGGVTDPVRYGKTFTLVHDPLVWREAADHVLREAGVKILFHTIVIDAVVEDGRVAGVVAWTKQGRASVKARLVIDASGDADVAELAGFETFVGQDGKVQNPTMIFRLMGVDVARFVAHFGADTILGDDVSQMIRNLHNSREYDLPRAKVFLFPTPRPNELLCNCTRVLGADGRELNPLLVEDITEAEIQGRRQVREYARFFKDRLVGCEDSFVNDTGVQVGVRQTRQIAGVDRLGNDDVVNGRKAKDSIARSAWPIELHSGEKPRLVWLLDDYYDVPFGCFLPRTGEGFLVAGRCLSAEHEAMASARVTAQCFSYGQAAGLAAAMSLQSGTSPRELPVSDLRDALRRDGAAI
jgi:glycine/D-amino acid oxidase-like deaminating enzyme